jgi:hypothetical protein
VPHDVGAARRAPAERSASDQRHAHIRALRKFGQDRTHVAPDSSPIVRKIARIDGNVQGAHLLREFRSHGAFPRRGARANGEKCGR